MPKIANPRLAVTAFLALSALISYSTPVRVTAKPTSSAGLSKIDHIVIVVQENRSFNNLFEGFPNATIRKPALAMVKR